MSALGLGWASALGVGGVDGGVGPGSRVGATLLVYTLASVSPTFTGNAVMGTSGLGHPAADVRRRGGMTAKHIISGRNRPLVNIAIVRINASGKAMASLSKGFSLDLGGPGNGVAVACVNFGPRALATTDGVRVAVGSRSGRLGRIMIMNCNARGGIGLANSMSSMSDGTLRDHPVRGMRDKLRNVVPNIAVDNAGNTPNVSSNDVGMHNIKALGSSSPCVLVSNMRSNAVDDLSPGSVRDVSMLGSTTSTTVCNSGTTGNIVLVAAGHNGDNGPRISCGNCIDVRGPADLISHLSSCRCTRVLGSTLRDRNGTGGFASRRRVGTLPGAS